MQKDDPNYPGNTAQGVCPQDFLCVEIGDVEDVGSVEVTVGVDDDAVVVFIDDDAVVLWLLVRMKKVGC